MEKVSAADPISEPGAVQARPDDADDRRSGVRVVQERGHSDGGLPKEAK